MKRLFVLGVACISIMAMNSCGSGGEKKGDTPDDTTKGTTVDKKADPVGPDLSGNPDYQAGLALVGKSNCATCHRVDETFAGPAFSAIANRYAGANAATIDTLAQKIVKGGNGIWGSVPMTPHPDVSEDDAKAMVKYVLLLKK